MPVQPTSDPFSATDPAAFGPYRITGVLGQGGMGTVYAAEQVQPIRRRVALKVIRGGLDSANVVARFEAERQALAVMEHPSIARVFDAGTSDGGSLYFVMEYVEGTTLGRYSLYPEDVSQFPRTVLPDRIDVEDRFTDKQETSYKYTVVIKLRDGSSKVGDPQIINKPSGVTT